MLNYPHPLPKPLNISGNFYHFYPDYGLSCAIHQPLFHKFDENTILLNGCLKFNKENLPIILYLYDEEYTDSDVRVVKLKVTKITTFQITDQVSDEIIFFPTNIHELTVNVLYDYIGEITCSDFPSDIVDFCTSI